MSLVFDLFFELRDALGDDGSGDIHLARGGGKTPQPGHSQECADVEDGIHAAPVDAPQKW